MESVQISSTPTSYQRLHAENHTELILGSMAKNTPNSQEAKPDNGLSVLHFPKSLTTAKRRKKSSMVTKLIKASL